jgi:Zn-dependent M16 (insulinase) family peptidase
MVDYTVKTGDVLGGFSIERVTGIPELRSIASVGTHLKTGARLLHLHNDDPNNLFCIAFRTPVSDNTGVPHILEHSVLAGSRKFPLKDPFKELLKGSLQTFLNALTYPDKTIYPVSSQVPSDFFNCVDVYCDAVFHPLLTRETFAQEGWHFDIADPAGPVNIKGIVYNEMKGVFSDFRSHVARRTVSQLLPDTTYSFESGGEPEHIPELTWEAFRAFHQRYYHPSNSFIILYGDIPADESCRFLNDRYLADFERYEVASRITPQTRWTAPRTIQFMAPAPAEHDGFASVILSWLCEPSTDPEAVLLGRIFDHYLFGNESSPLRRSLIDSGLGEDLEEMAGFESDLAQGIFSAGLRKTKPEHAGAIAAIVFDTLRREIEKNLDQEQLEGSLRQIEFRLREISDSGSFPYNLKLAERSLRSWLYGGDPLAHLCFEEPLSALKKRKTDDPGYFARKLKSMVLDNPHCLTTIVVASQSLGAKLENQTEAQAARLSAGFTPADRQNLHALTQRLVASQQEKASPETGVAMPRLNPADLPPENRKTPVMLGEVAGAPWFMHPLFTSGIVYLDIGFDLAALPGELLSFLPLYAELITRCGAAGLGFEEMARRISLSTGGIGSSDVCMHAVGGSADALTFKAFFHGKALPERFDEMLAIFSDLFLQPDLTDTEQINDILFEMRNDLNASVIASGHMFAVGHAAGRIEKSQFIGERTDGIHQLRFLDRLLKNKSSTDIVEAMRTVHRAIINRRGLCLSLTAENPDRFKKPLESFVAALPDGMVTVKPIAFTAQPDPTACAIEINSSVNYVARSWRVDAATPERAGEFIMMARNLSTGYLWEKIRVAGGAYGGMAMASGSHPVFSCASYRDPNLATTLNHFTAALQSLTAPVSMAEVDQGIVGTIGRIDKPQTPHARGFGESLALMSGRTPEYRQRMRAAILAMTPQILADRGRQVLDESMSASTIIGSAAAFDLAAKEGVALTREPLLPPDGI